MRGSASRGAAGGARAARERTARPQRGGGARARAHRDGCAGRGARQGSVPLLRARDVPHRGAARRSLRAQLALAARPGTRAVRGSRTRVPRRRSAAQLRAALGGAEVRGRAARRALRGRERGGSSVQRRGARRARTARARPRPARHRDPRGRRPHRRDRRARRRSRATARRPGGRGAAGALRHRTGLGLERARARVARASARAAAALRARAAGGRAVPARGRGGFLSLGGSRARHCGDFSLEQEQRWITVYDCAFDTDRFALGDRSTDRSRRRCASCCTRSRTRSPAPGSAT